MNDKEFSLFDIIKAMVFMAGAIYLMHLLSWFFHWGVIAAGMTGVGYLAYRIGSATSEAEKSRKQLTSENPYDLRMRQLEDEERQLDREIGMV